eukprot:scaffold1894_cov153-Pinguiococcus_pyrenoidosus.AAC.4
MLTRRTGASDKDAALNGTLPSSRRCYLHSRNPTKNELFPAAGLETCLGTCWLATPGQTWEAMQNGERVDETMTFPRSMKLASGQAWVCRVLTTVGR